MSPGSAAHRAKYLDMIKDTVRNADEVRQGLYNPKEAVVRTTSSSGREA